MKRMTRAATFAALLMVTGPMLHAEETGLMEGFPPPPDRMVVRENFMLTPFSQWAFRHMREIQPTREVWRGPGPVQPLETEPVALDELRFDLVDGTSTDLDTWLAASHTDAFLVLHEGRIVYERYFGGMEPHEQHQMFSATKSFVGAITLSLISEGVIDPERKMVHYVPELAGSAFGDATVQQVLDMTTSISFNEDYLDPKADIAAYGQVFGFGWSPTGESTPVSIWEYLPTLRKGEAPHGEAFHYVTPNTDALGWLNNRVTGKSTSALISERFWQKLGVERDAYMWLGNGTSEAAGGGLNVTARDAARFGQMILNGGEYNGQQVLPAEVAARILQPGNRETFTRFHDDQWYQEIGWAYHDQWWTFQNAHNAVSAIGVHGQFIYIDPVAKMVMVKQSSHPEPEGLANEVYGPGIWHQIAEHLMATAK